MDGIQFADGFDAPDRLAFGLGAPQLVTAVAGCLLAFAVAHVPLPGALTLPAAAGIAVISAALAWLRVAGRPLLEWALFAARHLARPRRGTLVVCGGQAPATPAAAAQRGRSNGSAAVAARPVRRAAPVPAVSRSNVVPLPARGARDVSPSAAAAARLCETGAHRVVFYSLKGGTGRTTLSTEIAVWRAAHGGGATVLVDCDVRSACVGARLGMAHEGLTDYALAPPDERHLGPYLARHSSGARVLLGPARPASPGWPVTPAVLREVLRELDLAGAEQVVVDVAPELNDLTRAALRAADQVLVVVVPTASGIQDAYRTTEQLRRLGLRQRLGYVVNRSRRAIDVSVVMNDLGGELLGEIPEDAAIVDAENTHEPAVLAPGGAAALELRRLATRVWPERSVATR